MSTLRGSSASFNKTWGPFFFLLINDKRKEKNQTYSFIKYLAVCSAFLDLKVAVVCSEPA